MYFDPLLAARSSFTINGLTRDELAAEKLLGWCSKPLAKHLVDLAYLGREHAEYIDRDNVADLVREKFGKEGHAYRYRQAGITSVRDLAGAFTRADKLAELRRGWGRFADTELLFLPGERREDEALTLLNVDNVERQAQEFWAPTLESLR